MANGKPSDPEEYVIRSGVRSGLKREFAFALKSQAELSGSLGRTRSRKPSPSSSTTTSPTPYSNPCLSPDPKRFKKSNAPPTPESLPAAVVVVGDEMTEPPPPKAAAVEEDARPTEEEPVVENPVVIDVHEDSEVDSPALNLTPHPPPPPPPPPAAEATLSPLPGSDDGPKGENDDSGVEMVIDVPRVELGALEIESVSRGPVAETPAVDKPVTTSEDPRPVTPSPSPPTSSGENGATGDSVELPAVISQNEGPKTDNVELQKPAKRFTRSSLKPQIEQEESGVENPIGVIEHDGMKDVTSVPEKPARRFTRSLLKSASEDGEASAAGTSSSSVVIDETKGGAGVVDDASLSITPSKKMELKMSKKIALNKFPANVRELLGTGLLEGLPVKYIIYPGKQYGLEGVIKGNGILCSCSSCNGSRVVSAYNFEVHSGSTKKHPSDYIFLDNGKSLHDVLDECKSAPLDMLESAIQNAIGAAPPSKPQTCRRCKKLFHTPRNGIFASLCDSCLQPTQPQMTPRPFQGTPSSHVKLPRNVLAGDASDGHKKTSSQKKSIVSSKVLSGDASDSSSKNTISHKKTMGRLTKKDLGLHKLVFMDDILPEGTEVGYYVRGKRLLEGYIKDSGIYCHCCNTVVSPSQFEAHAGRAARRKPYNNIYTSNGVSLHELSVSLSKDRKLSASENDDLCSICADGGDLLLCDLCPRAFHKECVGLPTIPKGDWYCRYCHNMHQRERCLSTNDNAIAAGRVAGVDPIEQIIKRCIRIVTTSSDIGGCALCRSHDFSKSGFDNQTVIICDQCEKEYHIGCLKEHNMCDLKELPEGEWFCSDDCSRIRASLQELLREAQPLQDVHADIIKKKCEEKGVNKDSNADVRWRLLSGKTCPADAKLLLSEAVTIFHESFDPIIDAVTGRDLIPSMVYGREVRDQDFGGMYCVVLTVNSSVVSAGILRVLGCEVAELPLVATSMEKQGLGYFQSLFFCIEKLLASLKVKHFVLPSADEAKSIWTKKFGFSKITPEQLREYLKGACPMIFQGTSMLYKPVLAAQASSLQSQRR